MKARKTCYGVNDVKIICRNCGKKLFAHKPSYDKADYICPYCGRGELLDFTEEKEWYGSYDSKKPIYDCFYLSDYEDYKKVQGILEKEFKDATFEDASDGIHGSRLGINVKEDIDVYRKAIMEKGLALVSFNFRMFMQMEPEKSRKVVMEYEEKQKKDRISMKDGKIIVDMRDQEVPSGGMSFNG